MEVLYNAKFAAIILLLTVTLPFTSTSKAEPILDLKETNYSSWNSNVTYISSTSYHARGMGPVYIIANRIVNLFMGQDVIPEGYFVITDADHRIELGPKAVENDWGDLLRNYWALLLVVCICALIIILMPIIGLCFCCCRCAGACGGRSQPFDKKHDTCRRVFLGLLLILAGTGLIFGVVVAFVTNSYLQQGVENATTSAREGVDDTQKFLKSTSLQVNHLLITNYDELSAHLTEMLTNTTDVVINKLEETSKAVSLVLVVSFAENLYETRDDLDKMKKITNGLRVNASQLSDGLRGVKRVLLVSLTKCDDPACKSVLDDYEIGKLDINGIDYNQIPDLTNIITDVEKLLENNIIKNIGQGKDALDQMRKKLNETIAANIPTVTIAIKNAGIDVRQASNEITKTLERISDAVGNNSYHHFDNADYYIRDYYKYVYYAGLAVSSVLLLVLLCVILGLLCGICGKRPDGYGDDCCNKGAGSRFLMIGVAVIFLTISILTVIALVYFISGMVVRRACVSLQNPTEDQIFSYIDQLIDLNDVLYPDSRRAITKKRALEPFRISAIIESCHSNESMFEVLRMNNYLDIKKIEHLLEEYGIDDKLKELTTSIEVETDTNILPPETEQAIKDLRDSQLKTFDSDKFFDNLNEQITKFNLSEIAKTLRETAEKVEHNPAMSEVRTSLKNQALHLMTYQENLVDPMTEQTIEMIRLTKKLDESFKFGEPTFEDGIDKLLLEIQKANAFLARNATEFVQTVAETLLNGFVGDIDSYVRIVLQGIQSDLGRCGPLSNVYKSLLVAGCDRVVDPFNGFWLGVAWSTLLFLPTIIIAVKLSTLYQKSDPYPGPLVESEYLYDAYSERDNIPLANGMKNKRRKKDQRRRSSRDRRGDYYEDSGSPHGPREGPRDARYNDMAPNENASTFDYSQFNNETPNSQTYPTLPRVPSTITLPNGNAKSTRPTDSNFDYDHSPTIPRAPSLSQLRQMDEKPRHWDGGPPRYQNAPPPSSEYERPPPYYFPGAPSETD